MLLVRLARVSQSFPCLTEKYSHLSYCLMSCQQKNRNRKNTRRKKQTRQPPLGGKVTASPSPSRVKRLALLGRFRLSLLPASWLYRKLLASDDLCSSCCFGLYPDVGLRWYAALRVRPAPYRPHATVAAINDNAAALAASKREFSTSISLRRRLFSAYTLRMCVCVCFLPIHSGHQVRWTYQPGSHRRKVTQDFLSTFFLRCVP